MRGRQTNLAAHLLLILAVAFVLSGCFGGTTVPDEVEAPAITTVPADVSDLANDATVQVSIDTATEGAQIYYTLDGSEPTDASELYDEAFSVEASSHDAETIVVKAIAMKEGMANSDVVQISVVFNAYEPGPVADPTITTSPVDTSDVANSVVVIVTLASATDGASIFYTLDGTTPTSDSHEYSDSFEVSTSDLDGEIITIKAIALKDGREDSSVSERDVVFRAAPVELYSVSGVVTYADDPETPVAGVEIQFTGGFPAVFTDQNGAWEQDDLDGNVTVTPFKDGFSFDPPSREVSEAAADVDFAATDEEVERAKTMVQNIRNAGISLGQTWAPSLLGTIIAVSGSEDGGADGLIPYLEYIDDKVYYAVETMFGDYPFFYDTPTDVTEEGYFIWHLTSPDGKYRVEYSVYESDLLFSQLESIETDHLVIDYAFSLYELEQVSASAEAMPEEVLVATGEIVAWLDLTDMDLLQEWTDWLELIRAQQYVDGWEEWFEDWLVNENEEVAPPSSWFFDGGVIELTASFYDAVLGDIHLDADVMLDVEEETLVIDGEMVSPFVEAEGEITVQLSGGAIQLMVAETVFDGVVTFDQAAELAGVITIDWVFNPLLEGLAPQAILMDGYYQDLYNVENRASGVFELFWASASMFDPEVDEWLADAEASFVGQIEEVSRPVVNTHMTMTWDGAADSLHINLEASFEGDSTEHTLEGTVILSEPDLSDPDELGGFQKMELVLESEDGLFIVFVGHEGHGTAEGAIYGNEADMLAEENELAIISIQDSWIIVVNYRSGYFESVWE